MEARNRELEEELRIVRNNLNYARGLNTSLFETVKTQEKSMEALMNNKNNENEGKKTHRLLRKVVKLLKNGGNSDRTESLLTKVEKLLETGENDGKINHEKDKEQMFDKFREEFCSMFEEQRREHLNEKEQMRKEFEEFQKEVKEELAKNKKEEVTYRCFRCDTILSNTLRDDGVSVQCTKCKTPCIVADPKEGFRWAYVFAPHKNNGWCGHFMEASVDQVDTVKCKICGTEGPCAEGILHLAVKISASEEKEKKEKQKFAEFDKKLEKVTQTIVDKINKLDCDVEERIDYVCERLNAVDMERKNDEFRQMQEIAAMKDDIQKLKPMDVERKNAESRQMRDIAATKCDIQKLQENYKKSFKPKLKTEEKTVKVAGTTYNNYYLNYEREKREMNARRCYENNDSDETTDYEL